MIKFLKQLYLCNYTIFGNALFSLVLNVYKSNTYIKYLSFFLSLNGIIFLKNLKQNFLEHTDLKPYTFAVFFMRDTLIKSTNDWTLEFFCNYSKISRHRFVFHCKFYSYSRGVSVMSDRSAALTDVIVMCDERVPPVDDRCGIGFPRQIFHLKCMRKKSTLISGRVDRKYGRKTTKESVWLNIQYFFKSFAKLNNDQLYPSFKCLEISFIPY